MSVFIDTNVLVRSIEPSSPMHEPAVRAIASVIESGEPVVLTPQVMAEFRNVVTRPLERNGLGLSPEEARDESYAGMQRYASFLWSGDVYSTWETLRTHIPIAINTGLTGIPYWGTDIGGFVPTKEFTA